MTRGRTSGWRAAVGSGLRCRTVAVVVGIGLAASGALAQADTDLEAAFRLLDENGDGVVARDEFQRSKTQIFFVALDAAGADQTLRPADLRLTAEAFAKADSDGDGLLSGAEFVQAPFMQFEAFDAVTDGLITLEEFLAAAGQVISD